MFMFRIHTIIGVLMMVYSTFIIAQNPVKTLPYHQIYAYGMDANVSPVFSLLEADDLTAEDLKFKTDFEARFKGASDTSEMPQLNEPGIAALLSIFRNYWRTSLLDNNSTFERELGMKVSSFLMKNYSPVKGITISRDSLGVYVSRYIHSKGFFTTEKVDYTGRLIDLMIWKKQDTRVYDVRLSKHETQAVTVFLLTDFVTLGWMEYATLGEHHAGGWTTDDALYCVKKSYDLESEHFKISYLAHEGRHFADKRLWPKLRSADLEYRAKLTELSLAKTTALHLIRFFIQNSNKDSKNPHQIANYCVIRDLSRALFNTDYESDPQKWEHIGIKTINKAAKRLLKGNTKSLRSRGAASTSFIKV